jgi:hypothetical protein
MQGNDEQSDGMQNMMVFPQGELRPRPSSVPEGRA